MGVLKSSHVIAHGLHRALAQTRSHTPRSDTRNVDIYATYHQISMLLLQFCRRYVLTYDHMLAGNTRRRRGEKGMWVTPGKACRLLCVVAQRRRRAGLLEAARKYSSRLRCVR